MKQIVNLYIDSGLLKEIEELRRERKRSAFIEQLLKIGIKAYRNENARKGDGN